MAAIKFGSRDRFVGAPHGRDRGHDRFVGAPHGRDRGHGPLLPRHLFQTRPS